MENGGLGEARAKAFLLERFWVLERSVDIQGADYLIQRQLTEDNFLKDEPPKLGVVQVKFIQDGKTYISIHKSYVCDDKDYPYNEFFLLVFTGSEDDATAYLLSARDIVKTFDEKSVKGKATFKVSGKKIIESGNFEIINKKIALDKIDHSLRNSSFLSNRKFLSHTNYVKVSPEQIEHDLLLPLDNGYTDFQEEFYKNKKSLQRTLYDIEDVVEGINKILKSTDPEEAFDIYEDVISDYIGSGWGTTLSFSIDFFEDEEFLEAVKNHKARLTALREKGLESSFLNLMAKYRTHMVTELKQMSIKEEDAIKVSLGYSPDKLDNISISIEITKQDSVEYPEILHSEAGKHIISYKPQSWFKFNELNVKKADRDKSYSRDEILMQNHWQFSRPFQVEVEKHLLGEELLSPWMT